MELIISIMMAQVIATLLVIWFFNSREYLTDYHKMPLSIVVGSLTLSAIPVFGAAVTIFIFGVFTCFTVSELWKIDWSSTPFSKK